MASSNQELQWCWARYRASGDPGLRDRLVLTLCPIIAGVLDGTGVDDRERVIGRCLAELISVVDEYDPYAGRTLPETAWTHISETVRSSL